MKTKIKAVLFDLDNTLVDFVRMKKIAVEIAVEYMINAGLPGIKDELINKIFEIYNRTHIESQSALEEIIIDKLGYIDYKILSSGIIGYQKGRDLATYPYPKVFSTLKELIRMGLQIGTISDAPAEQCYNRLARLNLLDWMDIVITFNDTNEYKPSPKPFILALQRLNLQPKEVIYVGDWPQRDIVGAKTVGMTTAYARWGKYHNCENISADYDLNSIEEIIDVVKKINNEKNF